MKSTKNKNDVYQKVTDTILDLLAKGTVPWHKPWKSGRLENGDHKNIISKKHYRGINPWLLQIAADEFGYKSPYWMTFRQAKQLGGNVIKGEKATMVVFWKFLDKAKRVKADDGTWSNVRDKGGKVVMDQIPMLRNYFLFNYEQTENIDAKRLPDDVMPIDEKPKKKFNSIKACETIVDEMQNRPVIKHSQRPRAFYNTDGDFVHMPNKETFDGSAQYYSVIFHELGHSTLHKSRLNRKAGAVGFFGDENYSKEELVAEMTAAMLCGVTRISPKVVDNQASYIKNWMQKIGDDTKLVVIAASQAQKAADYIQNKS